MAVEYELTVYEEDDATPLFAVGTATGHANPYLKAPVSLAEQEVDFARGAASIGEVVVHVVDVPTDPTDQDTGWFTSQLPDSGGDSAINGHRALLTENVDGGGAVTIFDGIVAGSRLLDTFSSYEVRVKDTRERERKIKAFETTDTPTVLPRGVLNGYGVLTNGVWAGVAPTPHLTGTYRSLGSGYGEFELGTTGLQRNLLEVTPPMREAFESISQLPGDASVLIYDRVKVLWRASGGGAWTELEQIAHRHPSLPGGSSTSIARGGFFLDDDNVYRPIVVGVSVNNVQSGDTLPTNGQAIEMIVQYDGPVTEDWNYHLSGLTVGEFLRNAYRGDYSTEDPRMIYDETALLALTTPVRARFKEPIADLRDYAEKHAYPVAKAAPTLNSDFELAPLTYILPDAGETLIDLDDTNCRPVGGGWDHPTEDAINVVRVKYKREYVRPATLDDGSHLSGADLLSSVDVTVERRIQASIDLLGEQPLEISSDLLRSIGTRLGNPVSGDVTDETGAQIAAELSYMAGDRFVFGGQWFTLDGARSDADVEGLVPGTWVTVSVSWMPDYQSGERTLSRLAQVISRKNHNPAWTRLLLLDAGSANAPVTAPTLGTVTGDSEGIVSVPVTDVGGGEARVDFATNATEPAEGSELWTFLGRLTAPGTLKTPPQPSGAKVWVRARGEEAGRRPSAWITAVSVTLSAVARIQDLEITIFDGVPTVAWTPNDDCLGLEIGYEVHPLSTVPTFADTVEVDAADGSAELPVVVAKGQAISIEVVPYSGWTGSAVSGSAGPVVHSSRYYARKAPTINYAYLRPVETTDTRLPARKYYLVYDVNPQCEELDIEINVDGGAAEASYTVVVSGGSGQHLLQEGGGDFVMKDTEALVVTVTPVSQPGDIVGASVVLADGGLAEIPIVTGLAIGFDTNGRVIVSWAGNHAFVQGYVTAGIGSSPSDPTSGTNDGTLSGRAGSLVLDGAGDTTERKASLGTAVYVKVLPENTGGVTGDVEEIYRLRGDAEYVPPRVQAGFERSALGTSATLTLDVADPSGAISAVEFRKREGSQDGDVFGSFASTWDTAPGSPYAGKWIEALSVPAGEESAIEWRITWTDEDGNSQTLGNAHYSAHVDEFEGELFIPASSAVPVGDASTWDSFNGNNYFRCSATPPTSTKGIAQFVVPGGCEITEFRSRLMRNASGDNAIATLERYSSAAAKTVLSTLTSGVTGAAFATAADTTLAETVTAGLSYAIRWNLTASSAVTDAGALWASVTFIRHTAQERY